MYPLTEDEKQRLKNIIAEAEEEYSQTAYKSNKDPYEDNDNSHSLSSSNHRTTASSSDDSYDAYHTLREDDYRQDYGDDYEDAIQDGWEERKRRNNT